MDFDYKKYSLNKLNEWMHDALSVSEATPQEIYDVIKSVVEENYYIYKDHTERCYELLALLNGNGKGHIEAYDDLYSLVEKGQEAINEVLKLSQESEVIDKNLSCDKNDSSPECKKSWNDFWEEHYYPEEHKKDKVVKWQLPVEVDGVSGEYYVQLPDDLLEAANLKEYDMVEWIDNNDGSFTMRKVNGTK